MTQRSNYPEAVLALQSAVSLKLGREAQVRRVNNGDQYYVTDLLFSYVQKAARNLSTGYRVGYRLDMDGGSVDFSIIHSPIMLKNFLANASDELLLRVLRETRQHREYQAVLWSSKASDGQTRVLNEDSFAEFCRMLPREWVEDITVPRTKQVNVGSRTTVRSYFEMRLGSLEYSASISKDLSRIVEKSWPLFLCLYPGNPIIARNASLARSLKAQKIAQRCEFEKITISKSHNISRECNGRIEGAHIEPYIRGGGDRATNGLWLCAYHHRCTEGKLTGSRARETVLVKLK
jgi:hypothetical protein